MAPSGISPFNAFSQLCTTNQCLQQVIGRVDNNPLAQFNACTSIFGSPTATTVTMPAETVFSTTTLTMSYTDIIVPVSTASSTNYVTSTSYTQMLEIATEYSSTKTWMVNEVVTLQPTPTPKRALKRRGKCGAKTSPSILTTSSAAPYPIASNCPSLDEYSSACSCINAVSSTATVTVPAPDTTSVVTVTESSIVQVTTSASVVTVIVPTTVVEPATSTITSTTTKLFETTITVTSTTAPTPTATYKKEVIVDPSFEKGGSWTFIGNAQIAGAGTEAHTGVLVGYLVNGGTGISTATQKLTGMKPQGTYKVQAYLKSPWRMASCSIGLYIDGVAVFTISGSAPATWTSYDGAYYHQGTTTADISITQACSSGGGLSTTWIDDVSITLN
ncbi:hypothetical protein VTI74DRAFT_380 [Chaetomium olivicolor]